MEPVVLVHGGAGEIKNEALVIELLNGVKIAARLGYDKLKETGSVLDAVETAVVYLEDNENYNAGKGSVITLDGEVEMDASIMQGCDLSCGSVTIVKDVKNPITLARAIMEKTEHNMLGGDPAKKYAASIGLKICKPGALLTKRRQEDLKRIKEQNLAPKSNLGTVGAVAIDTSGKLAAATSTGGFEGKMPGRCSDTSIIGAGTYADDDLGAVSTTGHGESIMKFCLAHEILKRIEKGESAQYATTEGIGCMTRRLKNTAGAITLDGNGDVGVAFSSNRMSWAYVKGGQLHYGINQGEHHIEDL